MKYILLAELLTGCMTGREAVQVKREIISFDRIEHKQQGRDIVYYVYWKDWRGIEYVESIEAKDTAMIYPRTWLLRR